MRARKPIERPFVESFAEKAGILKRSKDKVPRMYYLCGAITNDPHAELKFSLAEIYLKASGNHVINPMRISPIGTPWDKAIVNCLGELNHLGEFYRASLPYLGTTTNLPLPALLLIDPADREIESSGVKLEKGIALANGLPIVEIGLQFGTILEKAIKESEETK